MEDRKNFGGRRSTEGRNSNFKGRESGEGRRSSLKGKSGGEGWPARKPARRAAPKKRDEQSAPKFNINKSPKRQLKPGNLLNPVPVVIVSCGSTPDDYNILTVAWCGTLCSDPPLCYISVRPERHSYPILKERQEFVINLVTSDLAERADWCGVRSGKKFNKFLETDLTPVHGSKVSAPMIYESPINLECVVKQVVPLGTHDMFIAEIVAVHASEALFDKKTGEMHLERANLVAYSNGHYYNLGRIIGKFGFSVAK